VLYCNPLCLDIVRSTRFGALEETRRESISDDLFLQHTLSFLLVQYHLSLSTLVHLQHVHNNIASLAFPTSRQPTWLRVFIRPRNADFEPSFQCFLRHLVRHLGVILNLDITAQSFIRHTRQPVPASMSAKGDKPRPLPRVNLAQRSFPASNATTPAVSITRRLPEMFFRG
jgi:hypothetical protein